ncbi:peptidase A1 family protein [Abortiporus biennis]
MSRPYFFTRPSFSPATVTSPFEQIVHRFYQIGGESFTISPKILPNDHFAHKPFSSTPIVARDSLLRLPITKRINTNNSTTILQHDQARAQVFRRRSAEAKSGRLNARKNVRVMNHVVDYVVEVGIGSPPTPYQLLIDTASSNTWVGAERPYIPTFSSFETGQRVSVKYASGSFSGDEYMDAVSLGFGPPIQNQSIGVALNVEGFNGVDGVLGLGPDDLTAGTIGDGSLVPTVTDNLFTQDFIEYDRVSMSFSPPTTLSSLVTGELTFGETDPSKYIGRIYDIPVTQTPSVAPFWGLDINYIYYGSKTRIQFRTAGIVDMSTHLVLLASDAFRVYQQVTGAVLDSTTGLLRITESQYGALKSLVFNIHGINFELIPNAQIFPRLFNTVIGGSVDGIYLIIGDIGTNSTEEFGFILGMSFLERFYSILSNPHRVSFAYTDHTFSETN